MREYINKDPDGILKRIAAVLQLDIMSGKSFVWLAFFAFLLSLRRVPTVISVVYPLRVFARAGYLEADGSLTLSLQLFFWFVAVLVLLSVLWSCFCYRSTRPVALNPPLRPFPSDRRLMLILSCVFFLFCFVLLVSFFCLCVDFFVAFPSVFAWVFLRIISLLHTYLRRKPMARTRKKSVASKRS